MCRIKNATYSLARKQALEIRNEPSCLVADCCLAFSSTTYRKERKLTINASEILQAKAQISGTKNHSCNIAVKKMLMQKFITAKKKYQENSRTTGFLIWTSDMLTCCRN